MMENICRDLEKFLKGYGRIRNISIKVRSSRRLLKFSTQTLMVYSCSFKSINLHISRRDMGSPSSRTEGTLKTQSRL